MKRSFLFALVVVACSTADASACGRGLLWKVTHPFQAIQQAREARQVPTDSASSCESGMVQVVQGTCESAGGAGATWSVQAEGIRFAPSGVRFRDAVECPNGVCPAVRFR